MNTDLSESTMAIALDDLYSKQEARAIREAGRQAFEDIANSEPLSWKPPVDGVMLAWGSFDKRGVFGSES